MAFQPTILASFSSVHEVMIGAAKCGIRVVVEDAIVTDVEMAIVFTGSRRCSTLDY